MHQAIFRSIVYPSVSQINFTQKILVGLKLKADNRLKVPQLQGLNATKIFKKCKKKTYLRQSQKTLRVYLDNFSIIFIDI